ncbi:uncharacterized protein KY384_009118 [Bacidia gigantensis]|uniref:uncharacterized protein n=1 Tax=Bacidia gigantensis TaxID=2732470 RepID=UPI001D041134|nr:uncharacterized protein KY384_009118 [Bacidia gigantensis]KAG8525474.1 hypothetical protein KY384_009118 [Bacidia gigantensis]
MQGRSPFQSVEPGQSNETSGDEQTRQRVTNDSGSTDQKQKFDKSGRPINPETEVLKRRLRHAQNDVLAVVGLCHRIEDGKVLATKKSLDEEQLASIDSENHLGADLDNLSYAALYLLQPWTLGLRQRLQVKTSIEFVVNKYTNSSQAFFPTYGLPLTRIIASDWTTLRPISFLTAGAVLSCVSSLYPWLEYHYFYSPMIDVVDKFVELLPDRLQGGQYPFDTSNVIYTVIRPVMWEKLEEYFIAALPRPTNPERYSMLGYSYGPVSTLIPTSVWSHRLIPWTNHGALDVLAQDLQSIGRGWQTFYDRCVDAHANVSSWLFRPGKAEFPTAPQCSRSPSPSTPRDLPDDLREAMEFTEASPDGVVIIPQPSGDTPPVILEMPPNLQDLWIPTSENQQQENPINQRSHLQSPSPLSPRMPLGPHLPESSSPSRQGIFTEQISEATQASTPNSSSSTSTDTDLVDSIDASDSQSTASGNRGPAIHASSARIFENPAPHRREGYPVIYSSQHHQHFDAPSGPPHRITMLSSFSSSFLASQLATHFTTLLLLPLEALFVRSVAVAFYASPGLPWAGTIGRPMLYTQGAWFGVGLRGGGWRAVRDYGGKMFLVWGLQVGTSLALWEFSSHLAWWAGVRWYEWGNH